MSPLRKLVVSIRLDPDLVAKVRVHADDLAEAVEDALRMWLWVEAVQMKRRTGRDQRG